MRLYVSFFIIRLENNSDNNLEVADPILTVGK